jgi:hypothetical protein
MDLVRAAYGDGGKSSTYVFIPKDNAMPWIALLLLDDLVNATSTWGRQPIDFF